MDNKSKAFGKELLLILPSKDKTHREDFFKIFDNLITKSNISYNEKIVSLSTDGTPAMIRKKGTSKEKQR